MAYVPKDAEWFLAELVEEIRVAGHRRNVVHINYVLIHADSPKRAYQKAMARGRAGSSDYMNPAGELVRIRFLGLRNLNVIHDPLEDGCEIMFVEKLGVTKRGLLKLVCEKSQLEVFRPIRSRRGRPDYSSKKIMDEVTRRIESRNA